MTVQEGEITASANAASPTTLLGPNPVSTGWRGWFLIAASFLGATALLVIAGGVVGFLFAVPIALLGLFVCSVGFIRVLGVMEDARIYRRAVEAVRGGEVAFGWMARDTLCRGLCIVDEENRRLFLNGRIVGFDDVRNITTITQGRDHTADIYLASGTRPYERLFFDSEEERMVFFARFTNSLGMTQS